MPVVRMPSVSECTCDDRGLNTCKVSVHACGFLTRDHTSNANNVHDPVKKVFKNKRREKVLGGTYPLDDPSSNTSSVSLSLKFRFIVS